MRISDWSSDVCSSDLFLGPFVDQQDDQIDLGMVVGDRLGDILQQHGLTRTRRRDDQRALALALRADEVDDARRLVLDGRVDGVERQLLVRIERGQIVEIDAVPHRFGRSEEHTSELQSLMRISYAVFCLKKK